MREFLAKHKNPLLMGGSAVATILIWQNWFGILVTMILASTILIHEYGHVWQMKRYGMKTKGVYLTPIGGIAVADSTIKSYWQEVVIALMGPAFGIVYGFVMAGLFLVTGEPNFLLATKIIGFIHLFNFLPISPLDGGRVTKAVLIAIHPILVLTFLWLGVWACAFAFFKTFHLVFVFIAFFAFQETKLIVAICHYRAHSAMFASLPKERQDELEKILDTKDLTGEEGALAILYYMALILLALWLFASPSFLPNILAGLQGS